MKALKFMMMGMLVSLTASCGNDWLDVESSTKIPTETAIQNLDDVEYSLNGIYDVMRSTNKDRKAYHQLLYAGLYKGFRSVFPLVLCL